MKYLDDSELEHLNKITQDQSRDSLLIRLALATGARASELLNIRKVDLNSKTKTVFIRGLKNSRDRETPIDPKLFELLQLYSYTHGEERLFPITYQRLVQVWNHYKPSPDKTFHCLRHSFAVRLYRRHRDIKLVQLALGHRNIQNTMVYVDFVYSIEEMRRLLA